MLWCARPRRAAAALLVMLLHAPPTAPRGAGVGFLLLAVGELCV
jgi:peptidoglycan/LPS O-acetylase OafA/YrhL